MKKVFFHLAILLGALSCWSCSDDEDDSPFQGTDNTLLSFTLVATDGTEYPGAITGNEVVVTAPQNVQLSGAKATYTLCEQATISPDPAQVSDWDAEQQFTVTSYNKTDRTYRYKVARTDVSSESSVTLRTQADVQALAESGVAVIDGDLVIGTNTTEEVDDPVTDLSALTGLNEVKQNIFVYASFAGNSLKGLENIRSASALYLGSSTAALATDTPFEVELSSLKSLGSLVVNSNSVKTLRLPALKEVGYLYLCSTSVEAVDFTSLADCATDFIMKQASTSTYNTVIEAMDFPALKNIGGLLTLNNYDATSLTFPLLEQVGAKVDINRMRKWEDISFPELKMLYSSFNMAYMYVANRFSMPKLQQVNGEFSLDTSIQTNTLASVNLESLESVEGAFKFTTAYDNTYEALDFPMLKRVNGQLNLRQSKAYNGGTVSSLKRLTLPLLSDCEDVYVSGFNQLEALDLLACTPLKNLSLISCSALKEVRTPRTLEKLTLNAGATSFVQTSLPDLEEVTVTLEISNVKNSGLESYTLPGIRIIGQLSLSGNDDILEYYFPDTERIATLSMTSYKLTHLEMPKLTEITGNFTLGSLRDLPSDGLVLPSLTRIGGKLKLTGMIQSSGISILENLDAFSALTEVGSVTIGEGNSYSQSSFPNLVDFSGLKNAIGSLSASAWSVSYCGYNPTFADMQAGRYTKQD